MSGEDYIIQSALWTDAQIIPIAEAHLILASDDK